MILVKCIAIFKVSPSKPTANILTNCSVNTTPIIASNIHKTITILNTLLVNLRALISPNSLFTSKYSGINTVAKVIPIIANITTGMFIAVRYASLYIDTP